MVLLCLHLPLWLNSAEHSQHAYIGCTRVSVHTFRLSFSMPRLHESVCFVCGEK